VSAGKGVDMDAARASGVMEALELFHAERVRLPLRLGSWREIRLAGDVVPVESLPRISISAFHPDSALLWVQGTDLSTDRPTWVPFECVHTNWTLPFPTGTGCFVLSSNGLASGNHPLEAICHGLCEVIERDALALHYSRAPEQRDENRIDLDTVADRDCRALIRRFADAGLLVGVWDATSDIGLPTFECTVVDADRNPFRPLGPMSGMGCHPVREVALLRALTEAAQGRLVAITGSRDDNGPVVYQRHAVDEFAARERSRLQRSGARRLDAIPTHVHATLEEDLELILQRLASAGIEHVIAVDLTREEFGVPVFRVVVPGLEPYHRIQGYVPGPRARAARTIRADRS
jgi:ribosomal protein S12 methylthiotransferase accessory factor